LQVKDGTQISWNSFVAANLPDYKGNLDFIYEYPGEIYITKIVPSSSVKVTNGKLNITLGTPKAEYFETMVFAEELNYLSNITVTPSDANFFWFDDYKIFITSDVLFLGCFKKTVDEYTDEIAYLMYFDRDVTVKGTSTLYNTTYTYDCSFKKGWNYCISNNGYNYRKTTSSQTLPFGYYWVVWKN
jgi:hypothetical protein